MKKRGFTLVELLAVIVILAVIALITTPMIMDVIEKSKRGAAIDSVNGILDAAEKYQLESMLDGNEPSKTIDLTSDVLTYKGSKPESGTLLINRERKMSVIAKYGAYCVEKRFHDEAPTIIESERCELSQEELVILAGTGDTAISADILNGKIVTINDQKIIGTMPNKSGLIVEANNVIQEDNHTLVSIPESGYYDTTSQLSIPLENTMSIFGDDMEVVATYYKQWTSRNAQSTSITIPEKGLYLCYAMFSITGGNQSVIEFYNPTNVGVQSGAATINSWIMPYSYQINTTEDNTTIQFKFFQGSNNDTSRRHSAYVQIVKIS